jgi:hypothetical protein
VTLPEVITGDLSGKFSEISLYNQHADFESGSASNSNSTSPWAIACELTRHDQQNFALQPTCRLRVRICLQLELDVPMGHRMRAGYRAIVC